MKKALSILLSAALACFVLDGLVSFVDDSLILATGGSLLAVPRGLLALASLVSMLGVYALIGLTPMVPKRYFLPLALFYPAGLLLIVPLAILHFDWMPRVSWALSLFQALLGGAVLYALQRAKPGWPFVSEERLRERVFSVWNLAGFVAANVFVAAPVALAVLAVSLSLAVDHFSAGFVALRPDGLIVRARTYARDDGKTIQLIPMMHVGEARFYGAVSKSFTTNSVVMLEGVTDTNSLLKTKLTYKRMAAALGLTEQKEMLTPGQGTIRHADVDVSQFSERTIDFLNLVSRIYANGLTPETIQAFLTASQAPDLTDQFWRDILVKRNEHLLGRVQTELKTAQNIVVPWGAAHMPGLARDIQARGFKLAASREHTILDLGRLWAKSSFSRRS